MVTRSLFSKVRTLMTKITPTISLMSHQRLDRLTKTTNYYFDRGVRAVVCDNTPEYLIDDDYLAQLEKKCHHFFHDPSLSFYDQLNWHAQYLFDSGQKLVHICPDEDLHFAGWIPFAEKLYNQYSSQHPITCILGDSILCTYSNYHQLILFVNANLSSSFTTFGDDVRINARLSMIGQVPYLWRSYPSDFFLPLMKSVSWFGSKYGDKVAEQVVWNLLIPSMGYIITSRKCPQFLRRDSLGLRHQNKATVGKKNFLDEMKEVNIKGLALELSHHCTDFPSKYLRQSADFFEECLNVAVRMFSIKPWRFHSRLSSAMYYSTTKKKSSSLQEGGVSRYCLGSNDTTIFANHCICTALDLPIGSVTAADIQAFAEALG